MLQAAVTERHEDRRAGGITQYAVQLALRGHDWVVLKRYSEFRALHQVRKMPSWPRSWANFSLFLNCISTGMHGPTCIFWTNLTTFSLQVLPGAF